jgi:hypothetical protein
MKFVSDNDPQPLSAAADAAARLCRRLGIGDVNPKVLSLGRRTTIRLTPHVVARAIPNVGTAVSWMKQELNVVHHLVKNNAPVVGPSAGLQQAEPLVEDGFVFSLWDFVEHVKADENNAEHVALATEGLRRIHKALTSFREELPSFWKPIDRCRLLLADKTKLKGLRAPDRTFLLKNLDHLRASASCLSRDMTPIHGDAHLRNVFITAEGARWDDFEDVCVGPREWDISWFYEKADLALFEPLDRELVLTLHCMHKLCIAVWCYEDPAKHKAAAEALAAAYAEMEHANRPERYRR